MPNWCENDLMVEGKTKDVLAFCQGIGEGLDFNSFIPYPKEFKEMDDIRLKWLENNTLPGGQMKPGVSYADAPNDGYNSGGYNWCINNWGTKWGAYEVVIDDVSNYGDGASVVIHFNTAWYTCKPVVVEMSKRFPQLEFDLRYYEQGMGFHGRMVCKGGEILSDQEGQYFGQRGG